ncbi:hypothetical protein FIU87_14890 [Bacillus sp. THAF10]|uniref:membrane lipoprotein lipid attachment site-containing protein n=1 Tax=Bacillus sp. THAF10 TaxID=2587848 RepID=UPI0012A95993|nr:membrane lipoprotein lipid attachment site-containing protein [Bacillus sp. THAF10]QFT89949.1 hypothetical protein FIU87_14890 [Bacillus sp. THAF10]
MNKLFFGFFLVAFLTACSPGVNSTEEVIIVDPPPESQKSADENTKDGTLYTKKNDED